MFVAKTLKYALCASTEGYFAGPRQHANPYQAVYDKQYCDMRDHNDQEMEKSATL